MIYLDQMEFPLLLICLLTVRASHFTLSYSQYSTYSVDFWADGIPDSGNLYFGVSEELWLGQG